MTDQYRFDKEGLDSEEPKPAPDSLPVGQEGECVESDPSRNRGEVALPVGGIQASEGEQRIPAEVTPNTSSANSINKASSMPMAQQAGPLSTQSDQPLGRRLLKTRLCQLLIAQIRELAERGTIENPAEWTTSRQMWLTDPVLRAHYKKANALGDALGRGHGREAGLNLTMQKNRVVPSFENFRLCEQHLIAVGSSSSEIASCAGLSVEVIQDWVARLPRNNHLLPCNRGQTDH